MICCFLSCWCLLFQIIYKHETMDLNVISLTPWFLYWSQSVSYHWKHPSKHLRYSSRLMGTNHKFCNLCNKLIHFFFLWRVRFLIISAIVTLRKFQWYLSWSNNLALVTENSQNSRKRWRWWRFLPSDTKGWWGKRAIRNSVWLNHKTANLCSGAV